jgi:hypothetical protein
MRLETMESSHLTFNIPVARFHLATESVMSYAKKILHQKYRDILLLLFIILRVVGMWSR